MICKIPIITDHCPTPEMPVHDVAVHDEDNQERDDEHCHRNPFQLGRISAFLAALVLRPLEISVVASATPAMACESISNHWKPSQICATEGHSHKLN